MNHGPIRLALAVSAALLALPALATDPVRVVPTDWPTLERPSPARVLPAQPAGTTSAVSGDPTWPAMTSTMPAWRYPSRTDLRPVFDPPVEAHQEAMAAAVVTAQAATPARLAAK
jgi:hypothetical protein